jgi:heme-degrading monooxygenase HmoA
MIARIWHGLTDEAKAESYKKFLIDVAVKDYRSIEGFAGLQFLHRTENGEVHFTLITFWPSIEAIKRFAGADYEKAKYYPEDKDFLLEFEERVTHHEVFFSDVPAPYH